MKEPIKTIELGKYDYYDCEEELYVIYIGEEHTNDLKLDIKIRDEGVVWDCYLWKAQYISESNEYRCEFKVYEE